MHFPAMLQFKRSRRLRAALVFAHLLAFLALLALGLTSPSHLLILLGILLLVGSLAWTWRSIETPNLFLKQDGTLQWNTLGLEEIQGQLIGGVAFSWLVVLRIRLRVDSAAAENQDQTKVLVALGDSLSAHDFRQLQTWLRWVVPLNRVESSAEEP